uniref:Prohibitin n=1 Tax=Ascaris lumbricoides TaxID=6252 RepID=A0A0M3HM19_ASCLU
LIVFPRIEFFAVRQNSTDSVEGKKALHTSAAQLAAPTTTAADAVKKVAPPLIETRTSPLMLVNNRCEEVDVLLS